MSRDYYRGYRESYDAAKEHDPSKEDNALTELIQSVFEAGRDVADDGANQFESDDYQTGYKAGRDAARYGK